MTEQEKIEMGLFACKGCENSFCEGELCFAEDCCCGDILDRLTKAGYRKEEVVARETAQKIWEYCREKQYCNDEYIEWSVFLWDIQEICKQFGAEVDE